MVYPYILRLAITRRLWRFLTILLTAAIWSCRFLYKPRLFFVFFLHVMSLYVSRD